MPLDPRSFLTPEVTRRLVEALRVNPNWEAAADYAGISYRTLLEWRQRGERYLKAQQNGPDPSDFALRRLDADARRLWATPGGLQAALSAVADVLGYLDDSGEKPYYDLLMAVTEARSRGELELHAVIRKCAVNGDWRAAQALLKVGWRDRYADRVELTGAGGSPIEVEGALADAAARIEQALGSRKVAGEAG